MVAGPRSAGPMAGNRLAWHAPGHKVEVHAVVAVTGPVRGRNVRCPTTLGPEHAQVGARSGRVGETPVKQPTVTIFKNADDTWTAKIGTDTFVGTEEECIVWLDNE